MPEALLQERTIGLKPFLKWPGGKRRLVSNLLRLAPKRFNRYFEPFLGSGALFFGLSTKRAVLGDVNVELIECYVQLRNNCESVIGELRKLRNSEIDFYRIRKRNPTQAAARAARFIYLVRLAFNGIYRVNRSTGHFNVPYGGRSQLVVLQEEQLRLASHKLKQARLVAGDFEKAVVTAKEGDFVYLDPPYTLAHANNGFVRYNTRLFSWKDQVRLAECATRLARDGVAVIVSNATHPSILELYPGFRCIHIQRSSQVAAHAVHRGIVTELLLSANV
jgi:DNA adenine methylase